MDRGSLGADAPLGHLARDWHTALVRFLFGFVGGPGHFEPMAPLARAAAAAGHTVAVACAPGQRAAVERRRLQVLELPGSPRPTRDSARVRSQIVPIDAAAIAEEAAENFVRKAAPRRVPMIAEAIARFAADILITDEMDFGGLIAAEQLGRPAAQVNVIAAGLLTASASVQDAIAVLRRDHDLADHGAVPRAPAATLSGFPPVLRDPASPPLAQPIPYRAITPRPAVRALPRPSVLFTLGTEFPLESGDLFERALRGLARLPVELVVAVGDRLDPGVLVPQPPHVRVVHRVELDVLLPRCALVIAHGGSGTLLWALAHGLPQVLLPLGADQPANAARADALGFAINLDAERATPAEIAAAADAALGDPRYAAAARELARAVMAMPPPTVAVGQVVGALASS